MRYPQNKLVTFQNAVFFAVFFIEKGSPDSSIPYKKKVFSLSFPYPNALGDFISFWFPSGDLEKIWQVKAVVETFFGRILRIWCFSLSFIIELDIGKD